MDDSKDLPKTDHGEKNDDSKSQQTGAASQPRTLSTTFHVVAEKPAAETDKKATENNEPKTTNDQETTQATAKNSSNNKPPPIPASTAGDATASSSAAAAAAAAAVVIKENENKALEPPPPPPRPPTEIANLPVNDAPGNDLGTMTKTATEQAVAKEKTVDARNNDAATLAAHAPKEAASKSSQTAPTETTPTTIAQVSVKPAPASSSSFPPPPPPLAATAVSVTASVAPALHPSTTSNVAAPSLSTSSAISAKETAKVAAASTILKAPPPSVVVMAKAQPPLSSLTPVGGVAATTTVSAPAPAVPVAATTRDRSGSESISALHVRAAAATAAAAALLQQPLPVTMEDAEQEAARIARTPLTDLYDPYICPSDTCLADARKRLETAIEQTYKLQQDFTDRVYEKYKVCLKPPTPVAVTLATIRRDPVGELQRRTEDIEKIRIEKEMEKRDSTKLSTELTRAASAELNIDHAEQLMYLSSGLSLIILPEDDNVDPAILKRYPSGRGPVDLATGQRHRSLSNAAATSGEVMLNRRRKADALRNERNRRKQLYQQNRPKESVMTATTTNNAAALAGAASAASVAIATWGSSMTGDASVVAATLPPPEPSVVPVAAPPVPAPAPPQKKPPSKKQSASSLASGSKSGKGRASSTLTTNALLSLNPLADQMDNTSGTAAAGGSGSATAAGNNSKSQVYAPATAALVAKGVGENLASAAKSTQVRLKHPHPESLGGKRRASSLGGGAASTAAIAATTQDPKQPPLKQAFQQEFLKQSLPPLPSTKDRLERKPVAVYTAQEAATTRVRQSLRAVLAPFHNASAGSESSAPNLQQQPQQQPLLGKMTKIEILRNLWKLDTTGSEDQKTDTQTMLNDQREELEEEDAVADSCPLDPLLTFMVLNAVGLIRQVAPPSLAQEKEPAESGFAKIFSNMPSDACTDKLNSLRKKVLMSFTSTVTTSIFADDEKKRRRSAEESPRQSKRLRMLEPRVHVAELPLENANPQGDNVSQRANDVEMPITADLAAAGVVVQEDNSRKTEAIPVESIRGGGEESSPDHADESDAVISRIVTIERLPAERIRGGGEMPDSKDNADRSQPVAESRKNSSSEPGNNNTEAPSGQSEPISEQSTGRKRSGSLPSQPATAAATAPGADSTARTSTESAPMSAYDYMALAQSMPVAHASGYMTPPEGFPHGHNMNSLHLAQQLGQGAAFHHPAAGDIAGNVAYLNALHQRHDGFDFSSFVPGAAGQSAMAAAAQSSLAALGLARQNQAMYDQQAGALLRGAAGFPQGTAQFGPVGGHPSAAVAAFLGPNPSSLLGHGQYGGPMAAMYHQQLTGGGPAPEVTSRAGGSRKEIKDPDRKPAPHQRLNEKNSEVRQRAAPVAQSSDKRGGKQKVSQAAMPESGGNQAAASESSSTRSKPANGEPRTFPAANSDPDDATQPAANETAMKFFKPGAPSTVSEQDASLIRAGKFHEVVARTTDHSKKSAALEYLVSVGAAVPIPKALILVPLKERVNTPGTKITGSNGSPAFPRDVVVSAIMVWLWANNEHIFQSAFEKSGRIDVDPDCKWLVQAAVETSFRELASEIANERSANKGPFAENIARKSQTTVKIDAGAQTAGEGDRSSVSKKLEIHTAAIVSKALMAELNVDAENNSAIPLFQSLVDYLDEARLCALRAKSQERTLLATLISRRTMMSEAFSNAYVSAMVRAGEALGHGKLFECVQNEDVGSTTMIPYDVFTDDSNEWEDPCKPEGGFEAGCSAVELSRKAHARACIQKSLKKLQDRHNIRGGTASSGPYADQGGDGSSGTSRSGTPSISPRVGFKRKFSSLSEPPVPPGTGSASAKSWAQYDPRHFSAPLEWTAEHVENTRYGRHHSFERPRSLSLSLSARAGEPKSGKKVRRSSSMAPPDYQAVVDKNIDGDRPRATRAIHWGEVAGIFQRVELPKKSPPSKASGGDGHHGSAPVRAGETIFAPFCRKFVESTSEDESDTEEDLSDATVLANHQAVLDEQKHKRQEYTEAKRKQQERRKTR